MYQAFVIDDEPKVRKGLSKLIPQLDEEWEVVGEAENGVEGLKQIEQLRPHLVFTDIRMPMMDGLDLLHALQTYPLQVVILTGYGQFEYAQAALKLAAIDYLLKPTKPQEIFEVLSRVKKTQQNPQPIDWLKSTHQESKVQIALEYIHEYYKQDLSLEDCAASIQMNPSYFSYVFKQEMGVNFIDYLTHLRIEKAKELMESTNQHLYEISQQVGYSDHKYFSRIFKRIVGVTPSGYRSFSNRGER
ncbi:two component transcriptional regulator, AraC family [Seinonella peptonophila]|uniref:Two component transcriptional regulator, AraC family n=1 Tax=Seinonella peptonophila TaxID=112248 RepID=A0A1M4T4N9_9BACL|nr:response regulator [Seinonella peptonophila]SHE39354.1 two component transcriptional regulator, AraC family [Seinonella peptonophila]